MCTGNISIKYWLGRNEDNAVKYIQLLLHCSFFKGACIGPQHPSLLWRLTALMSWPCTNYWWTARLEVAERKGVRVGHRKRVQWEWENANRFVIQTSTLCQHTGKYNLFTISDFIVYTKVTILVIYDSNKGIKCHIYSWSMFLNGWR